jgi:Spy/CpxP family protein refolding chaperone
MKIFFQRNIRRIVFGVLGVTLIAGGLSACGHHGGHQWGANVTQEQFIQQRDKLVDRAASKLDLNADQKLLLAAVGDKVFEQRKAMMGQTTDPRAELKSLIAGPKFDTAKAQALITDKTTVMQAKSPETLAALAAFYDSLNVAQQQKVRDLMEGRHGWFNRG